MSTGCRRLPRLRVWRLPVQLLCLLLFGSQAAAGVVLSGGIAELTGPGWQARQLTWSAVPQGVASVKVASLSISDPPALLSEIDLRCAATELTTLGAGCQDGTLSLRLNDRPLSGRWTASAQGQAVEGSLTLMLAGGELSLTFGSSLAPPLRVRAAGIGLAQLLDLLPGSGDGALPGGLTAAQGSIGFELAMALEPVLSLSGSWSVSGLSFDSLDGSRAGADLALRGTAAIQAGDSASLGFSSEAVIERGELLLDPAYLSFSDLPEVRLTLRGERSGNGAVRVSRWELTDGDSLRITGDALLSDAAVLTRLSAKLERLVVERAYPRFLAAVGESFGLQEVDASGTISGGLTVVDAGLDHLALSFDGVNFTSNQGRFGASALNGTVDYSFSGDSADSALSWESLRYYTLLVGAASSRFFAGGGQLQLLDPLFLPVLDGGLQVDELALSDLGTDQVAMDFRGELRPVALDQITRALDWPVLYGTLGGTIPQVRLRNQVVEVGGNVVVDVFGGKVTMEQLRLERLFGVLPTLSADVDIEDIDLEQMTGAFSFGKIEGVLQGSVKGLRLLNWRPVAFDLDLHTDPDAGVRQRISQRAVDNLSSIGGGAAALGSTVLKIFDDFGYRQLGLTCVLRNNTCDMGGVGDAGNGYYLVRGSGIPRIDIKGFSRRVDWPNLVRRLKAATESGPASVE